MRLWGGTRLEAQCGPAPFACRCHNGGRECPRLAAIDMYGGGRGAAPRRIILAVCAAGPLAWWRWAAGSRQPAPAWAVALGTWIIGAGLNHAPLAAYAITLSGPGALEAMLAGVDTGRELCRYCVL